MYFLIDIFAVKLFALYEPTWGSYFQNWKISTADECNLLFGHISLQQYYKLLQNIFKKIFSSFFFLSPWSVINGSIVWPLKWILFGSTCTWYYFFSERNLEILFNFNFGQLWQWKEGVITTRTTIIILLIVPFC